MRNLKIGVIPLPKLQTIELNNESKNVFKALNLKKSFGRNISKEALSFFGTKGIKTFEDFLFLTNFANKPHTPLGFSPAIPSHNKNFNTILPKDLSIMASIVCWIFKKNGEDFQWEDLIQLPIKEQQMLLKNYAKKINYFLDYFRDTFSEYPVILSGAAGYRKDKKAAQTKPSIHTHIYPKLSEKEIEIYKEEGFIDRKTQFRVRNGGAYRKKFLELMPQISDKINTILKNSSKFKDFELEYSVKANTEIDPLRFSVDFTKNKIKTATGLLLIKNIYQEMKEFTETPSFNYTFEFQEKNISKVVMAPSLHGPAERNLETVITH